MEYKEYNFIDKSKWPVGIWQSEPDKIQFQDEKTGYPCLIVRNKYMGFLCGYVGVDEKHPCYEKRYDDIDVNVHGGLTFSEFCLIYENPEETVCHTPAPEEPDNVWWLGFDCGHFQDLMPRFECVILKDLFYKDVSYVKEQIAYLAKQLKEMEK